MKEYSPSYTAGGLLLNSTEAIIDDILSQSIRKVEIDKVKINRESSRIRTLTELKKRFRIVPELEVWKAFNEASNPEKNLILYYISLKSYPLLFDFHFEVVLERWKIFQKKIAKQDFESFLSHKIQDHPEIEEWSETTKEKAATVSIRMIREAGLLYKNELQPPRVDDIFWDIFIQLGELWFLEAMFLNKVKRDKLIANYD